MALSIASQVSALKMILNSLKELAVVSSNDVQFRCHKDVFSLSHKELAKIHYLQALHANTKCFMEKPDDNGIIVLNKSSCDPLLLRHVIDYIKIGHPGFLIYDLPAHIKMSKMLELLDFLCVEKPKYSLHVLDKELKTITTSTHWSTARVACFKLCWCGLDLAIGAKEQFRLLNMVLFIMSNPQIFYFRLREMTIGWYLQYCKPTVRQRSVLLKLYNKYQNQYFKED